MNKVFLYSLLIFILTLESCGLYNNFISAPRNFFFNAKIERVQKKLFRDYGNIFIMTGSPYYIEHKVFGQLLLSEKNEAIIWAYTTDSTLTVYRIKNNKTHSLETYQLETPFDLKNIPSKIGCVDWPIYVTLGTPYIDFNYQIKRNSDTITYNAEYNNIWHPSEIDADSISVVTFVNRIKYDMYKYNLYFDYDLKYPIDCGEEWNKGLNIKNDSLNLK